MNHDKDEESEAASHAQKDRMVESPLAGTAERSKAKGFKAIEAPSIKDLIDHAAKKKGNHLPTHKGQVERLLGQVNAMSEAAWQDTIDSYDQTTLAHALPTLCRLYAFESQTARPVWRPIIRRILNRIIGPVHDESCNKVLEEADHGHIPALINTLLEANDSIDDLEDLPCDASPRTPPSVASEEFKPTVRGLILLSQGTGKPIDDALDLLSPVLERLFPPGPRRPATTTMNLLKTSNWEVIATCDQMLRQRIIACEGREHALERRQNLLQEAITAREKEVSEGLNVIHGLEQEIQGLKMEIATLKKNLTDQKAIHDADLHSSRGEVVRLIRKDMPLLEKALGAARNPTPRIRVVIDHLERVIDSMSKVLDTGNGAKKS